MQRGLFQRLSTALSLFVNTLVGAEDPNHLLGIITIKHWAAYLVEENRGGYDDHVNAYDLSDSYFPAFRRAVTHGNAAGVMCSYNSINGVPTCASQPLSMELLRGTWGFDGLVHVYAKQRYWVDLLMYAVQL